VYSVDRGCPSAFYDVYRAARNPDSNSQDSNQRAPSEMISRIITFVVTIALAVYVMRQVRKPDKFAGRAFLWAMNLSHSGLTDWGLRQVAIEKTFKVLDIGCGGGRTIQTLAGIASEGTVSGVDYASGGVAVSRSKNTELIKTGRVDIREGSVSHLPFPDNSFDLATAIETQSY